MKWRISGCKPLDRLKHISLTRKTRSSIGVLWFQTATVPSRNPGLQGRKLPLREILIYRWIYDIYGYPVSIHTQISSHKQTLKNQRAGDSSAFCLPYCAQSGDYSLVWVEIRTSQKMAQNQESQQPTSVGSMGHCGSHMSISWSVLPIRMLLNGTPWRVASRPGCMIFPWFPFSELLPAMSECPGIFWSWHFPLDISSIENGAGQLCCRPSLRTRVSRDTHPYAYLSWKSNRK